MEKKVKTASIVDVMCCLRQMNISTLKTIGDLRAQFLLMTYGLSKDSSHIDFVFDTYMEGSVKDSEQQRRLSYSPKDFNVICEEIPLPFSGHHLLTSQSLRPLEKLCTSTLKANDLYCFKWNRILTQY